MKWTIGTKISGIVAFAIAIFLILGIISTRMVNNLIASADWNTHTYKVLAAQESIISLLKDAETGQRGFIITGEENYLEPFNSAINKVYQQINSVVELTNDNPEQQESLVKLRILVNDKIEELNQTIELRRNDGFDAALNVVKSDLGKEIMDSIRVSHVEFENHENELLKLRNIRMINDTKVIKSFFIYGISLSILIILIIGILIIRNITRPLKEITKIASSISNGDLSMEINTGNRKDEVGILLQNFSKMVNNLRRIMKDISEGVNLLSSSSSEIVAATTQVASGSAETASAISETSTTVEEVRQAAQLSSQKASRVSENAQQVAQITQTGQKAVEETVNGMHEIQNQMEDIANTIVRLSEQSQQIGGIIASVNDVADQSNLLAVNAAIEAAKAGEQGKGFAVVAQEIKNLALQSKQATIQVRNILNDVQKATSAAVMATEQGSKMVENGVKQSAQTGKSIRVLSESVNESVQATTQIVASSQQQTVGMDQIGLAMQNINQAGTENAASMMQAEKAAKDLNELGLKLKMLVEQYKI